MEGGGGQTAYINRETTGKPVGERIEMCIQEHNSEYTGNATCSGGVVNERVANAPGTQKAAGARHGW